MQSHHVLRGTVHVASAAVVAQTTPQTQHLVLVRSGQISHRGEARHETRKVLAHRDHLRLLQHDFRQPHGIRVLCVLPWQVMTAMFFLPRHQGVAKAVFLRHGF
jgi:hypothetical protein